MSSLLRNLVHHLNLRVTASAIRKAESELTNTFTLRQLTGVLHQWRIPTLSVKIKPYQLAEVSLPAIAPCQSNPSGTQFVLLTTFQNEHLTYQKGTNIVTVPLDSFAQHWDGTLLLLAPDENSGQPGYPQALEQERIQMLQLGLTVGAIGGVALLGLALAWFHGLLVFVWLLLCVGGIGLCLLLLAEVFGQPFTFTEHICQIGPQLNCRAVLNTKAAKWFGWLSLAEVGFVFFVGQWLKAC